MHGYRVFPGGKTAGA